MFSVDPAWRRLDAPKRASGRAEFAATLGDTHGVTAHAYSTLGLKTGAELLLWWRADAPETMQRLLSRLLATGMGQYCTVAHSLWGLTRPSLYTKKRTTQ